MASMRLDLLAKDKAVAGDLIEIPKSSRGERSAKSGRGRGSDSRHLNEVHVVTEDEELAGTYSIDDVVLPLPGQYSKWPQHEVGLMAGCKIMKRDGILGADLDTASKEDLAEEVASIFSNKDTHLARLGLSLMPGGYRKLVRKATNVEWRFDRHPADTKNDLEPTDIDRVAASGPIPEGVGAFFGVSGAGGAGMRRTDAKDAPIPQQDREGIASNAVSSSEEMRDADAGLEAESGAGSDADPATVANDLSLVLQFSLPKSCYATMLLREVCRMKTDRSSLQGDTQAAKKRRTD